MLYPSIQQSQAYTHQKSSYEMENTKSIARIYAWPPGNKLANATIARSSLAVMPEQRQPSTIRFGRHERPTTPISSSPPKQRWGQAEEPYIQITLDVIPKTSYGIVFGCDLQNDVVLPDVCGVSGHHFSITFDDKKRLILRDLNSTSGTEVTYGDTAEGFRSDFTWIVGGVSQTRDRNIIVSVGTKIQFRIVSETSTVADAEFSAGVDRLLLGSVTGAGLFDSITARLLSPAGLTGAGNAAKQDAVYVEKYLSSGTFGTVTYLWNVSTGQEMVLKEPNCGRVSAGALRDWKHEAEIMKLLRHVCIHEYDWTPLFDANSSKKNILQLLDAEFEPNPRLFLEYCPGQSLEQIMNTLSVAEIVQVLQQCLCGLRAAHHSQIAHRDIKPDNILVASRQPLQIKLADFGLSKRDESLKTRCGTYTFMAPEMWGSCAESNESRYTKAIDIWALGLVVVELLFGSQFDRYGLSFCKSICDGLASMSKAAPDSLKEFLANNMIRMEPDDRSSAALCYARAMDLPKENDASGGVLWNANFSNLFKSAHASAGNGDSWPPHEFRTFKESSAQSGRGKRTADDSDDECRSRKRPFGKRLTLGSKWSSDSSSQGSSSLSRSTSSLATELCVSPPSEFDSSMCESELEGEI